MIARFLTRLVLFIAAVTLAALFIAWILSWITFWALCVIGLVGFVVLAIVAFRIEAHL